MEFFDSVVNKSNAIFKERLGNPFGQKQQSQDQTSQDQAQQQQRDSVTESGESNSIHPQASTSSVDNIDNEISGADQDKKAQFSAIAADAEAVAHKAAKGAQKFGTFLFSMANKAGQHVTQTAKQVKQAVESTSILTDFTREQQDFIREHGVSMEGGELPWLCCDGDEKKTQYLKEQILSLSQDKRNFVRSPPQKAGYRFDQQKCYPIALLLLKEDPNLNKMRYELVPKLVNEDTFWCNYFYRVEMLKREGDGNSQSGWASSRSSSGEGPDEVVLSASGNQLVADEPLSPSCTSSQSCTIGRRIDTDLANRTDDVAIDTEIGVDGSDRKQLQSHSLNADEALSEASDPLRVVDQADDLKNRLKELNIGSFDGSQDG